MKNILRAILILCLVATVDGRDGSVGNIAPDNSSLSASDCLPGATKDLYPQAQNQGDIFYLYPYNMHLTNGVTSAEPLVIRDTSGNVVSGTVSFLGYDATLISIDAEGYVTPLRAESGSEIGTWVQAIFDGGPVVNTCIVRVLSQDYGLTYSEIVGEHTVLYFPIEIDGEDMTSYVSQYEIPLVDEYNYQLQSRLMGLAPFSGGRQILELDFGETEAQRVCGISGNPLRLGWNIAGNEWQNCFLVPFMSPRSPQWFIFYHEIGHNFTWPSYTFGQGLGPVGSYSEGLASAIALETMNNILDHPDRFPIDTDAKNSLQFVIDMNGGNFENAFQTWLGAGAVFGDLDANIVDGLWLQYRNLGGENFARRFFLQLQPRFGTEMDPVLDSIIYYGDNARHTLFAALTGVAMGQNLSATFINEYHFPILPNLHEYMFGILTAIVDAAEFMCGDANDDETINIGDAVYIINYVFKEGEAPIPLGAGDSNCDGTINVGDAVYVINYVFKGGGEPCCP